MRESASQIHAYHPFGEALRPLLASAFPGREYVVWTDEATFRESLEDVELLFALHPPPGHWARARCLKLIQMSGAGIDALLPAPELPESVRIANARGVHEPEMPEFILALILALAKRLPRALEQQARSEWRMFGGTRLAGATVGILGLGAIGQSVARRCRAFGMRVVGTRSSGEPLEGVDRVFRAHETLLVLAEADVVVVLLPLTPHTHGLLDGRALAAMKPGALLVNAARGGIVDETALAEALAEGRLGGAAMDVFEHEPLPASSPLWSAPGCLVTPHMAGLSRDYMQRVGEIFCDNILRLERGEPLHNEIDRARGY